MNDVMRFRLVLCRLIYNSKQSNHVEVLRLQILINPFLALLTPPLPTPALTRSYIHPQRTMKSNSRDRYGMQHKKEKAIERDVSKIDKQLVEEVFGESQEIPQIYNDIADEKTENLHDKAKGE